jgi:hypothetical protein
MSEEPTLDIEKQIRYWRDGALESWKDAEYNITGGRIAFGLFAIHLNIEGRYPGIIRKTLSKQEAQAIAKRTKVALEWLIKQL